jgi:hypothetical protein
VPHKTPYCPENRVRYSMNKSQQMRWSRRGADLLLQVRCAVYNGLLGSGFGHLFEPVSSPGPQLAKATDTNSA